MKKPEIQGPPPGHIETPTQSEDEGADSLHGQRHQHHIATKFDQSRKGAHIERFLNDQPFFETDSVPGHDEQESRHSHKSQTADLNEQKNNHLSKMAEVRSGIDHHQPGDAHRGRRCEQRIQKVQPPPALGRDGQAEKDPRRRSQQQIPTPIPGPGSILKAGSTTLSPTHLIPYNPWSPRPQAPTARPPIVCIITLHGGNYLLSYKERPTR